VSTSGEGPRPNLPRTGAGAVASGAQTGGAGLCNWIALRRVNDGGPVIIQTPSPRQVTGDYVRGRLHYDPAMTRTGGDRVVGVRGRRNLLAARN
jgi:hypothetical protein